MNVVIKKIIGIYLFVFVNFNVVGSNSIDRESLVSRHNVTMTNVEALSPLSVGNGHFCHTVDITGMQTFPDLYEKGIPLSTMSEWGWHSFPNTENYKMSDVFKYLETYGRKVPYPIENVRGYDFLRANPHQTGLALIGLQKIKGKLSVADLEDTHQRLDLWKGVLDSHFKLSNVPVEIVTFCHPDRDQLVYKLKSSLFSSNELGVQICFPFPSVLFAKDPTTLSNASSHQSKVIKSGRRDWIVEHKIDDFVYYCHIQSSVDAILKETSAHNYLLSLSSDEKEFNLLIDFYQERTMGDQRVNYSSAFEANQLAWKNFWMNGGAIDLSGSKDPRWMELERRIVLSQYLTAIQSRQQYPPQETGLTCNSWYGKFHLEMHWWHSVHFALWNRSAYLANTLNWYQDILEVAKSYTVMQGYKGVRWPKMTDPDGIQSPSYIAPLLIWQQPHPIFYCELLYRDNPTLETVKKYSEIINVTAEFMYDFAHWDADRSCYVLGPPVISAREGNFQDYEYNINPTFELAYWSWGLKKANEWKERLGEKRNKEWDRMADQMAPWPIVNGLYVEAEAVLEKDWGHPTQLAAYGFLPETKGLNKEIMRKSLKHVIKNWPWAETWGWDFPLIAMTAIRLGEPELALEILLKNVQKNTYLPNGHNYQNEGLPLYLPGNGGLLTVVAMMCAGWDGCKDENPGFPKNGEWIVKWENLKSSF